jgi:hypothetical protein
MSWYEHPQHRIDRIVQLPLDQKVYTSETSAVHERPQSRAVAYVKQQTNMKCATTSKIGDGNIVNTLDNYHVYHILYTFHLL